jgi:circadian clock protein KaiC
VTTAIPGAEGEMRFVFRDEVLAQLLGDVEPNTLFLVLGHPGAGKSTFVASVVFENVLRFGVKGVYISLAEDKEKFYSYMRRLGMDFAVPEGKGLFEYVHVPTLTGRELVEVVVERLSQKVVGEGARIAVIDSVTPLLNALTTEEARSMLHATLYSLTSASKALLMLIADLPFATESTDLKGLEFIADAVFVFKTKIEKGIINRVMEVRKFRGKPIPLAEIPFTIEEERGFRCLLISPASELPYTAATTTYREECSERVWGPLLTGTYIGVISRAGLTPFSPWLLILKLVGDYGLSYGIISFREPAEVLKSLIAKAAEVLQRPFSYLLSKASFIVTINPVLFSPQQLEATIYRYVEQNVNLLVIDGVDSLYLYYDPLYIDRMLKSLATYARGSFSIVFEFVNNVYTPTQLSRYDIVHEITVGREGTVEHSVVRGRLASLQVAPGNLSARIDEASVLKCLNVV